MHSFSINVQGRDPYLSSSLHSCYFEKRVILATLIESSLLCKEPCSRGLPFSQPDTLRCPGGAKRNQSWHSTTNACVANVFVIIAPATVSRIFGMKPGTPKSVFKNGEINSSVASVLVYSTVLNHGS